MDTILVIEDQLLVRTMLCDALRKNGFQVIEAEDGMEGMNQVQNENISLVITDLVMPNFDGVSFLNLLVSCHPDMKVISWTSLPKENSTYQEATKIIGKNKVLQKSGNFEKLIYKVKEILK